MELREDLYDGQVNKVSMLPDGYGVKTFAETGAMYQGYFERGLFNGFGVWIFGKGPQYGCKYEGEFLDD